MSERNTFKVVSLLPADNTGGRDVDQALRAAVEGIVIAHARADVPLPAATSADVLLTPARARALRDFDADIPWIHVWGTGVDGLPAHVFQGRVVTCGRGAGAIPISEFVMAALLSFEKRVPSVWIHEPPEVWNAADLGSLHGKRVAVFGLGGIGSRVASLCVAFGAHVRGLRRTSASTDIAGVEMVESLPDLVKDAHHVVVTAPLTSHTRGSINASVLRAMRPGVHIVNVARGRLIDHDALRAALDNGHVAMATLDTAVPEPVPAGHWLYSHPGVRLSPHVSWVSEAGNNRLTTLFVENALARRRGRALGGIVDPIEGY